MMKEFFTKIPVWLKTVTAVIAFCAAAYGWVAAGVQKIENRAILKFTAVEKEISNDHYLAYRKNKDAMDSVQFVQLVAEVRKTNELLIKVVNNEDAMQRNWKQFLIGTQKANGELYAKLTSGLTEILSEVKKNE